MLSVFVLTSCSPMDAKSVVGNLLPNLWVFLSHAVATIVLLIIVIWLVWKPTKNALANRREYIQSKITQAEEIKKDALKNLQESEQAKIKAYADAKTIVSQAVEKAYIEKERIEDLARKNSDIIQTRAKDDTIKIKSNIEKEMNQQILDITFAATQGLLKKKITKKDSDEFVNEFINSLTKKERR